MAASRFRLLERLRTYLLAGILLTAPVWLAVYLAWWAVSILDRQVDRLLPPRFNPDTYLPFTVPGLGVLMVLALVTAIGAFAAGYLGRRILAAGEGVVEGLPVLRHLYGGAKQVAGTVIASRKTAFRQVVMLKLPRRSQWSPGFVVGGEVPTVVQAALPRPVVAIYVPTTPFPAAGFLAYVPPEEVHPTSLTVEEGLELVVSGGIVQVPRQRRAVRAQTAA